MSSESEVIETTVGDIAVELERRGFAAEERVRITIEPEDWLSEARRKSRRLVIAAGLTDDDIDRIIKQAQKEVEPTIR